jgi:aminopeptidase N
MRRITASCLVTAAGVLAGAGMLAGCSGLQARAGLRGHVPDPPTLAPGVSRELARHRAATLAGVHYAIELDVTLPDRADGVVTIDVERRAGARDLVLDFRGTALHEVVANGTMLEDAVWEDDHVVIPERFLRAGPNRLRLRFTAPVAAAGAAIIAYDDAQDGARYLYTLLVPSDAQLLFPVFDQPDLKARFTWIIVAPAAWRVLANGALEQVEQLPDGRQRSRFAPTQPISTYTASFAAGPWTVIPEAGVPDTAADHVGMTLWTRRSRAREVDADTIMALNRSALHWLEEYFDTRYPFGRLDLLLAPAFPFGGMEHVAAIFYNESNFIFREAPTEPRRLARAATIYHEVAHQWFGDLVTMRWFDDLWLKEGFATFMAARLQHQLEPGADAWKTFYLRNKPLAYGTDATAGTTPVWQALPNLDLAKSNYGPIVYNKAPAILKQLEFMVGEDAFREGVRLFLRRHAFGNATWRDLLDAIGTAARRDLGDFGRHYIMRAGLPLVETQLTPTADGRIGSLALVQRPARDMPGDPGGWWPGRVRVRLGYHDRDDVVLDVNFAGTTTHVRGARGLPAPDFVFANDGDYGYGIFLPDPSSAAWLLEHAHTMEDGLLRAMAWGGLWDLVREARLPPDLFAQAALRALPDEEDEQVAALLLGRITYALERYVPRGDSHAHLVHGLEQVLLARIDDEALGYGLRRAALDALLAGARSVQAVALLNDYLAGRARFNGEPLAQPSRWAAVTRLLVLGNPEAPALLRAEIARDSTPEAPRMAFIAGAAVRTAANKQQYFERYFADGTLNEEWVTASLSAFNHPLHAELALPFLEPALERAEWIRDNRRIFFLPRWVDAFVGGHASAGALAVVDGYLERNPALPADVRRRILQARDELERAVRIRDRFGTP